MLFSKSKNKDASAKRNVSRVESESHTARSSSEDVLSERLFEDAPSSSSRTTHVQSEGLILDIEPGEPTITTRPLEPSASIATGKPGWFSSFGKKSPAKPTQVPSPPPAPVSRMAPAGIVADDLIFDIEPVVAKVEPSVRAKTTQAPTASTQPKKRWFSGFARAATPKPSAPVEARKQELRIEAKPEKARPLVISAPLEPVAKIAPKNKAARGKGPTQPFVLLEIAGARKLFWQVTEHGIETRDEIPAGETAVSFAAADLRFAVEGIISNRKADALAMESTGEPVYLLNRSRELTAVYATTQLRFAEIAYRVGPGALLLESLYSADALADAPAIIGFQLKDQADKDAVVILYYRAPSGELSAPQISIYPDNLEFVLSQFATANQARSDAKLVLFDNDALRAAAASLALYPNQPMLGALSIQAAWKFAMAASILAALGTAGWAGYNWKLSTGYTAELAHLKQNTQELHQRSQSLLEASSSTLAKALSLPLDPILARSTAFWVPGAKVKLTADGNSSDFVVLLPLNVRVPGHSLVQSTPESAVEQLRTLSVPIECKRKNFNFSGALNDVSLTIHCEDPLSSLARYRGR